MISQAPSVNAYLISLPDDRRAVIESVLAVIRKNLDPDLEEGMQYGMIGFYVPHRIFPAGYHCNPQQPLPFAALAAQKSYFSLYMMSLYGDPDLVVWFEAEWAKTGKKLNMGKSCVRFKTLDDLPLDLIGKAFKKASVKKYIAQYEANLIGVKGQKGVRKNPKRVAKKK